MGKKSDKEIGTKLAEKLAKLSNDELSFQASILEEENSLDEAVAYYDVWLDRELDKPSGVIEFVNQPSDSVPSVDWELSKNYSKILRKHRRYDDLIEFLTKVGEKNYSYRPQQGPLCEAVDDYSWGRLERNARIIAAREPVVTAIKFIRKAIEICPRDSTYHNKLLRNLDEARNPPPAPSKAKQFIDSIDREEKFKIIEFTAGQRYVQPGIGVLEEGRLLHDPKYRDYNKLDIALGQSRVGGPVVDLPEGKEYPEGMVFVAQLDMAEFSPYDSHNILPKTGQLYLFWDLCEGGVVYHADVKNEDLRRVTRAHIDAFYDGVLIDEIRANTETLAQRYCSEDEDDIIDSLDDNDVEWMYKGRAWDDQAAGEVSKMFGIYTHCQLDPNDIAEIAYSDKMLLLQIGEGYDSHDELNSGFNDTGVLLVLIPKEDLVNGKFDRCEFEYADIYEYLPSCQVGFLLRMTIADIYPAILTIGWHGRPHCDSLPV